MSLTPRQKEVLDYIQGYLDAHGYAPSFDEIAANFQFRSLATVHEHLTNLQAKGYVRRDFNRRRAIEVVPPPGQSGATEVPLLGQVAAGEPIEAVATHETLAVPNEFLPRRGNAYALRVRGDSMVDDHILDGDYVIVHSRQTAENGQTVIALIEGTSATVKRVYREPGGWVRLQPANERLNPIRVHEDDLIIQGIVVGVIRKY